MEVLKRVELSIRGDSNSEFKYINIEEVEKEFKNTNLKIK